MTEDKLIEGILNNDVEAFSHLLDTYSIITLKVIKSILNKSHEEDFIVQCFDDVILKVWKSIGDHNRSCELKYWICTIAKNKALDYKRKLNKCYEMKELKDFDIKDKSAEEEFLIKEEMKIVQKVMDRLKPKEKELFIDKFIIGLTQRELENKYIANSSVIYKRISRLREKIRKIKVDLDKEDNCYE
ncbi:sigma-70 family RNA polymerase sigma factor [Clostridium sardiniense]|uniref:Sigma-70 family RNA polymerase sigma factor n=1 Tax=Clostridium sardiniense TaxID=29369 RepID=A0ABS7KTC1_CLOSR|nr:sigma-70 family RNA polymerase sigma factor [Clostridium sardiniense]MBY0754060.1 sigma-70 family RNA polymerase sigma factor [Clostridium sardiniense]MDQ0459420.1 RNA polymerase sigma-70 factor (ECF subfamily) [Clostridium sardiniense]